ncbi:hypothetical protein RRG08_020222 [Elysia crispata]|uniref:Uncharacterized protein n=1 Tax=Elysia crispata TaxID=231223 RepID=A0AAE1A420_9GAST|nr:hypothetical protein RRG08_020222 [Elysia crispata]
MNQCLDTEPPAKPEICSLTGSGRVKLGSPTNSPDPTAMANTWQWTGQTRGLQQTPLIRRPWLTPGSGRVKLGSPTNSPDPTAVANTWQWTGQTRVSNKLP